MQLTHEQYILTVRDIIAQLAYGFGRPGLRGVTIYSQWACGHDHSEEQPFIEICAAGEESTVQLAGTTIRELAHGTAGIGTRGGTSRGTGSGSRMRKYVCEACGQIIRAATDELDAAHNTCPAPDGSPDRAARFVLA